MFRIFICSVIIGRIKIDVDKKIAEISLTLNCLNIRKKIIKKIKIDTNSSTIKLLTPIILYKRLWNIIEPTGKAKNSSPVKVVL